MSVKYFDKEKGEWIVFPGVKGESAYEAAKKGGFTGTEEEFNKKLANAGNVNITIDDNPTYGSKNAVSSGGVYNEIEKINDTINNIDVSTQLEDYLTKSDADYKYEPLMNAGKELFKVKSQDGSINPFTYGSTLDLSAIDVEVEVSDDYTVFAYHYSQTNPGAPSGGSVDTSYSILYPKDWYGSDKVDEWLNDDQELNIWMSYATFIVGGDIVGSWSYPIKVAKDGQPGSKGEDGVDGATGAGIEFVYCRIAGKKITSFPSTTSKPDNNWGYDSPTGSWSDNPKGVNIDNQTEWVCVRTKAEGSDSWDNWSNPALFSVFAEDGQDGGGFEYIFIRNNISDFNQDRYRPVGTQEDDSIPEGWSDNALTPTKDEPYVWVSTRKKSSTWGDFSIPTLWTWYVKDGEDGAQGEQGVAGAAGYTISTVYLYNRGNSTPELPNVSLQYDIQNNELYLNSESWNDSVWSLSVPTSTGESSLYRTEVFVKTNTPDEYITINPSQWSPVVVIAMDGSNGEDGTGESATQVTIDPDAMLLPVKSSGVPHLAYTFKFNTKFFYGTSEQTIVNYTKFKTDDENGVDLPNGIYSLSATYSDNNVLYTAVIDINSTIIDPIIIPITLSANINDAEISKKNSISIVPTVQENPVIYTIEPNKNQFKIYDGINEYLKVNVYRIDGDVKTEATDVTLRYHYGDLNDDDTIDINDWIIYPEEGINIQNENADIFGGEIILGIFNDGDNSPMLQNVVTLVYDGEKGDSGYDGASREYMFKLSNNKPSIVNELGELDLTDWTDNPTGISEDNPKEWYITRNRPFMGEWNSWEEAGVMLWSSYGEKGKDGPGFEYIYTATQASDDIPEVPVVEQVDDFDSFTGDRKGWVDDVISPDEDNPIIWVSTRKKSIVNNNMIWSNFSEPKVWNKYVKDGDQGPAGVDADSIGRIYVVGTEKEYTDHDPQPAINEDGEFVFTEDLGIRGSYQECYDDTQTNEFFISHGYIYVWCLEYLYNVQQGVSPYLVNYYRMTPTIGAAGQTGKIIYPAGIYDTTINYVATSTAAPYVYDQIDKKYYIYNHEEPWFDILGDKDVPASLSGHESDWIPMEGFNAIYTEIGIIENGTVGDAVFNKGKMFSKDGAYYNGSSFVETTEDDGNYSLFGYYIDEANKTDDYYSNNHKFHPNTMIDFDSGKAVFGRGSVQLAKSSNDTSVFDSKVEVNNEFVAKYKDKDASDVVLSEVNVSPKLVIMRSTGGQIGEKVGSLEIKSIPNDNDIHFPEFYITAKDPRSDDVINSTVEGDNATRSDYSRITLQEYINRCISNFLYGKTKDSYEILGISSYDLTIGSNSTETTSLNMSIGSAMGISTGTYKWEGVVGSIMYNTQTCTTVDASDLKWNCTVAQTPASGINISIYNSKLLNGSTVLNSGVLSISGSAPTSLFLNTINSVTGEEFNWTEATADIILSPTDSSFAQTISLKITK